MKIAFLIQCHKDPQLINKLIKEISLENSDIYIHIDIRSNISKDILKADNVFLIENRFKVDWGSFNQVLASLELLKTVYEKKYDYISLISGQDFPIYKIQNFIDFLEINKGAEFIEYFNLPTKEWRYEGGIGRIKYRWINSLTPKRTITSRILRNIYLFTIGRLRSKDISYLGQLYGGSQWFTITGTLASFIITFLKDNPNYLNVYSNSGCADEIFFQTLIMNSPYKENVISDNLRFIKWKKGNSSPEILTLKDKDEILNSKKFFMRKIECNLSKELLIELRKK